MFSVLPQCGSVRPCLKGTRARCGPNVATAAHRCLEESTAVPRLGQKGALGNTHRTFRTPIDLGRVTRSVFRYAIVRLDLKTPGRDTDQPAAVRSREGVAETPEGAGAWIAALGGAGNPKSVDACTTRLRLQVNDHDAVLEGELKALGAWARASWRRFAASRRRYASGSACRRHQCGAQASWRARRAAVAHCGIGYGRNAFNGRATSCGQGIDCSARRSREPQVVRSASLTLACAS